MVSLGISDDWSFESHFAEIKDVYVYAFDASLDLRFWAKRVITETIKNPLNFYAIRKLTSYKKFFSGKHKHIKKFVGLNSNSPTHCTLNSILENIKNDKIFLKIDVEGSEYRLLDEIILNQNRITGLVIELHDCDIHLQKIEKFIRKFNLNLIHIHANNFSPVRLDDGLPLVMELTFSKYHILSDSTYLPHKLDMPCNSKEKEINLIIRS